MHESEPSLLSHLVEVRGGEAKVLEGGLSMVIYSGRMRNEGDSAAVLQMHRLVVEEEVNKQGVNVTGLLMGQGTSVMHFLEGPSSSVLRILANLAQHEHFRSSSSSSSSAEAGGGGGEAVQSGRIVYCVEDRPERSFPEWYSCIIAERRSQVEDVSADSCKDVVHELATGLLQVGKGLQVVASTHQEVELSKYADHLPGKNLLLALGNSTLFFSLEEFVKTYADPYHIELESESVWPIERLVRY